MNAEALAGRLRILAALPGIAGHEGRVAAHMQRALAPAAGAAWTDPLGNLIARFGPPDAARRIAVLAHMDTVGLLVKQRHADGTLGVVQVGGVNVKALPGAAVQVWAAADSPLPGVIGVRSQHLAQPGDAAAHVDDLYVQVDPARAVPVTAPITYAPQAIDQGGGLFASPHLDDRAGCALLLALGEWLADHALPAATAIYLVGTVQEETTCAGAVSALRQIAPEWALFVDGTLSYDTPDTRGRGDVRLGGGPVLTSFLYVSGLNGWHAHPGLRAHLLALARDRALPHQQDAIRGLMSDARAATWLGVPSAIIGLPMRGKHAPLETVQLDDLAQTAHLLVAALSDPYKWVG
jgi:putative aminopeptidase FrvX